MMNQIVRRGAGVVAQHLSNERFSQQDGSSDPLINVEIPPWGVAIFVVTSIAFLAISAAMGYTLRHLMVNLAIVESPARSPVQQTRIVQYRDDPDAPVDKQAAEQLIVVDLETVEAPGPHVTHSIRQTLRLLKSIGGVKSYFRGFRRFAQYTILSVMVQGLFQLFFRYSVLAFVGPIVAAMVTARFRARWTHATLTMPSSAPAKGVFRGLVSRAQWKQLLLPNAVKVAMEELTMVNVGLVVAFSVNQISDRSRMETSSVAHTVFFVLLPVVAGIAFWVLTVLPATVALTRIEASLLPEGSETVVPMDGSSTTFSSYRSAYRTFTGVGRLVKLYTKAFLLDIALVFVFIHIYLFEAWAILGEKLVLILMAGLAFLQLNF